jgi:hypothetical protein
MVNGEWYDVVVDDFLPFNSSDKLVFCHLKKTQNELWPCFLEKSLAKFVLYSN